MLRLITFLILELKLPLLQSFWNLSLFFFEKLSLSELLLTPEF